MYVTQTGRRFALAHHSLLEWASIMKAALIHLGCSEEYAQAVYLDYVSAMP